MKPELTLLVCAVGLAIIQIVVAVLLAIPQVGLPMLLGNREDMPSLEGAADRAQRAYRNMLESLVLFAALVLAASAAGRANATVVLGCQLFVWGRLAYAIIYVIGIPLLRTLSWAVALVGMLLILFQLT